MNEMNEMQETIQSFDNTLKDFFNNLKIAAPSINNKITELENEINNGILLDFVKNYNQSIKKYERRIINKDVSVINRISNIMFSKLRLSKIFTKVSDKNKDIIWDYLKSLYLYSEIIVNSDRENITTLAKSCIPVQSDDNNPDSIDQKIQDATNMLTGMIGGNSKEMSVFNSLIKDVAGQVGDEIKKNGNKIDTENIMKSFGKLMSGGNINDIDIDGINMSKIIDNASQNISQKIEEENIDITKFQQETSKKLNGLMKGFMKK